MHPAPYTSMIKVQVTARPYLCKASHPWAWKENVEIQGCLVENSTDFHRDLVCRIDEPEKSRCCVQSNAEILG